MGMDTRLQGASPTHPDSYRCNREIWRLSWFCKVVYIIAWRWCSVASTSLLIISCISISSWFELLYIHLSISTTSCISFYYYLYHLYYILWFYIFYSPAHPFRLRAHNILYPIDIYYPISMGIYRLPTISRGT